MPILSGNVLPYFIMLLRVFQDLHVHIHHAHSLLGAVLGVGSQRAHKRQGDAGETDVGV